MNIAAPSLTLNLDPVLNPAIGKKSPVEEAGGGSFGRLLTDLVDKVDGMQKDADRAVEDIVTGKTADIHQVSVKMQEAGVAFDLMVSVRNRLMDAYNELMKIQA